MYQVNLHFFIWESMFGKSQGCLTVNHYSHYNTTDTKLREMQGKYKFILFNIDGLIEICKHVTHHWKYRKKVYIYPV